MSSDATTEILVEIYALKAQIAQLATVVVTRIKSDRGPRKVDPLRLTTAQVLAALNVSRTTLDGYVARGLCRPMHPKGRGRGKPVYFAPDEIEALAISEELAQDLMARKRLARGPRAR